ncbi:MAG: flagellar hook protein FlgE [Firmicutes bacterium]|nr:flagellar hook protein FlgE [Bacillota bacterium]
MLRSLSAAVSGLRNHQNKLDVVGNNIANVNTVGFKSEMVRFQDIFSQTVKGANAPAAGRGGTNPVQVGLGMALASTTTVHTGGAITATERETDLAIEGSGFFVVSDGIQNYFTRDGSFARGFSGDLLTASGLYLMGWEIEKSYEDEEGNPVNPGDPGAIEVSKPNTAKGLTKINIPLGEEMIAQATSSIKFAGNLNSGTATGEAYEYVTYFYDSLGNRYNLTFKFTKGAGNTWGCVVSYYDAAQALKEITLPDISFEEDGSYLEPTPPPNYSFTINAGDLGSGAADVNIKLDFSLLTQLKDPNDRSSIVVKSQDGYPAGELVSFNIEQSGKVTGSYSNGLNRALGWVALASFSNPEGLMKVGSNLFNFTVNSGDPRIGVPGELGRGLIQSRALELSNVDLAYEFTEMITTSRGYQANARVISTSDEVLTELINIKR